MMHARLREKPLFGQASDAKMAIAMGARYFAMALAGATKSGAMSEADAESFALHALENYEALYARMPAESFRKYINDMAEVQGDD